MAEKPSDHPSTGSGRTEDKAEIVADFPFMLSLSKHRNLFFSKLATHKQLKRIAPKLG
jgi:hypothetical protein